MFVCLSKRALYISGSWGATDRSHGSVIYYFFFPKIKCYRYQSTIFIEFL